jgi:hypothetical protein
MIWDDSANAFVAEENDGGFHKLALVYDGSNADETNFPIGHQVSFATTTHPARNAAQTLRLSSTMAYANYGSGSILAGTYRTRGRSEDEGSINWYEAQKVA